MYSMNSKVKELFLKMDMKNLLLSQIKLLLTLGKYYLGLDQDLQMETQLYGDIILTCLKQISIWVFMVQSSSIDQVQYQMMKLLLLSLVIYIYIGLNGRHFADLLTVSDEDESPYIKKTISDLYLKQDTHRKSNSFDVINGLIHSSPSDLVFKKKKVVWHLIGWGTHWDIHYVKWEHGKAVLNDKQVDQVRLFPASFYTVNLQFNESGQWKFGYLDQKSEGMTMYYNVSL